MAGDSSAMPTQQGVGVDEPAGAPGAGECLSDRTEHSSVVVAELGPVGLSAQHHQLVAQHDDLEILGTARAHGQTGQRREEAVQDATHTPQDRRVSSLVNAHVRVSGTHRVELANAMFDYLEIFHNRQRRHSSIGMLTPIEYENLHHNRSIA